MPCTSADCQIVITSAEGETPTNGDNDPSDGAFMEWVATGSGSFYFSRIYNGLDTITIVQPGTSNTVFAANEPDGISYRHRFTTGEAGSDLNSCLQPGTWTVQVWDVMDADGDRQPDVDGDGNIIGCFTECSYTFFPSCYTSNNPPFTVGAQDLGCNGTGGNISLSNFQTDDIYCVDNDGGGATFSWTSPNGFTANTRDISNLEPGIYSLTAMDFYGCSFFWTREIVQLDNVVMACNLLNGPTVFGASDGSFTVDIIAGSGDYSIAWSGPVSGSRSDVTDGPNVVSNLPAGTYTITVTDALTTCEETCTIIIPDPPCELNFAVSEDVFGNITVTVLGGTPNFFISYAGPTAREDIGPFDSGGITLSAGEFEIGDYIFTAYEAGRPDCAVSRDYNIPGPDCSDLTIILNELRQISCAGLADGLIDVSFTGDHNPVLSWTGPGVSGSEATSIDNLGAGNYAYEITDSRGCFLEGGFDIIAPQALLFTCGRANESLPENDDGKIWADFSGGTPPFLLSYQATAPDGSPLPPLTNQAVNSGDTLFNLSAGTYLLNLVDSRGCSQACTAIITEPVCDLALSGSQSDISCFGEGDGAIFLDISAATTGLLIDWNVDAYDGQDTLRQLPPGTYSVSISDDTGCPVAPLSFIIMEPENLTVDLSQTEEIQCFGEETAEITSITSGGQGALSFGWSAPNLPDAAIVSGLSAGDFGLTVTDTAGCEALDDITISEPSPLQLNCGATAETGVGQSDGSLGFTISGGTPPYVLLLNGVTVPRPATDTFRMLPTGNYQLEITDANNCSVDCSAVVNPGDCGDFSVSINAVQPDCNEATGSATAMPQAPNGTLTYRWSNGQQTASITDLAPAIYAVTVTDEFNCDAISQTEILAFTDIPTITLGAFEAICEGRCSAIDFIATGSFPLELSFQVSGAGTQVQGMVELSSGTGNIELCPTDFGLMTFSGSTVTFLTVSDANGCSREVNALRDIFVFPPAIGQLDTMACPGDTVRYFNELFHTGRTNDQIVIPLPSVNGCDSSVLVSLTFFAPALGALDTTICFGDTLEYFNELFYADRTSDEVLISLPSVDGCDSTVFVSLDFFHVLTGVFDTTICIGDVFMVGDSLFDGPASGKLVLLEGRSSQGCDSLVNVSVRLHPLPLVTISGDGFVCEDGLLDIELTYEGTSTATIELSSQPGLFFQIPPGRTVVERQVTPGSTITILSASDEGPCSPFISGSIVVTGSELALGIDITSGDGLYAVSCAGDADGSVLAVPTGEAGPFFYQWSNGATTAALENIPAGGYSLRVTSSRGCQATAQVLLLSPPVLVASIGQLPANCLEPDPRIILRDVAGGVGPYLYRINDNNGFRVASNLPDTVTAIVGTTRFQLEGSNGCGFSDNFSFDPPPVGDIVVTPDLSVIRRGDSIRLRVLTDLNANRYRVSPGYPQLFTSPAFFVAPTETTTYDITAIDELGCTATTTAKVVVDRYVPVYIPNAFSPNSDGVNDTYQLYGRKEVVSFTDFQIYNRWGHQVYLLEGPVGPQDTGWGWNGMNQEGRLHEQGVYVFTVTVTFLDGRTQELKGDLVLMR